MSTRDLEVRRSWTWPLRTGLMTILAITGMQAWFTSGCGGSVDTNPKEAAGGSIPVAAGSRSSSAVGGAAFGGTSMGTGGSSSEAVGGTLSACPENGSGGELFAKLFAAQAFQYGAPPPKVLYSWTTPEQIGELRNGGPLFSRSERPDLGRGNALDALAQLAAQGDQLAIVLSQKLFATARYAWINPWATRMGWPDEQYGNQLIRVELVDEAWMVVFDGVSLTVFDSTGKYVSTEAALADPSRVGSILYTRGPAAGGPQCGTFGSFGSPSAGGAGYREIVLGNLAMVKRWSLGTADIAQRLDQDIEVLAEFQSIVMQCAPWGFDSNWNSNVTCSWDLSGAGVTPSYVSALAIPSDYYQPTVENLGRIIDTLKADGFPAEPYVVNLQ
jgi:hypothetical protein